jgi:hypothetical protein
MGAPFRRIVPRSGIDRLLSGPDAPVSQGKETHLSRTRFLATAATALLAVSLVAPSVSLALVPRTVMTEEFGFST